MQTEKTQTELIGKPNAASSQLAINNLAADDKKNELLKELESAKADADACAKSYRRASTFFKVVGGILGTTAAGLIGICGIAYRNMDSYFDSRVNIRAIQSERLDFAIANLQIGRFDSALVNIDMFHRTVQAQKFSASDEARQLMYQIYIVSLANLNERSPGGGWVGQHYWDQLTVDADFTNQFQMKKPWKSDKGLAYNLALCSLKFEKGNKLDAAKQYLNDLPDLDSNQVEQANAKFALAMISLINGKPEESIQLLKQASEIHPAEYLLEDLYPYRESFLNSPEGKLWKELARANGGLDFVSAYSKLTESLNAPENTSAKAPPSNESKEVSTNPD